MNFHNLPKITAKSKKRLGRGYGSGKGGHTVGRGQKGQTSRSKLPLWFEGGQLPLSRRLPFLRGKDRFKSQQRPTTIVNLKDLDGFQKSQLVTKANLVKHGLISLKEATGPVKILGDGKLSKALKFKDLKISKTAAKKIEKIGGQIT